MKQIAKIMKNTQIKALRSESIVEDLFINKFGCMQPWFTENVGNLCSEKYTVEQWKNMSDYIFPTMDNTFIHVIIKC